jgi:hypothetical protein
MEIHMLNTVARILIPQQEWQSKQSSIGSNLRGYKLGDIR